MIAATNSRRPTTTVPEMPRSLPPRGLSLGSTSSKIVFMSVAARVHSRYACSPISGQSFTDSAGDGIEKIFGVESLYDEVDAADQAKSEPCHGTYDDHQA